MRNPQDSYGDPPAGCRSTPLPAASRDAGQRALSPTAAFGGQLSDLLFQMCTLYAYISTSKNSPWRDSQGFAEKHTNKIAVPAISARVKQEVIIEMTWPPGEGPPPPPPGAADDVWGRRKV